jgi:hypothetical protein
MESTFSEDRACTCAERKGVDPSCPAHGYKPNPKLAASSWVQPYVRQS